MAAIATFRCRQQVFLLALGTGFGQHVTWIGGGTAVDIDAVDRSVTADVAGKIEDPAVDLAVRLASPAPNLLDQEAGRTGWPQQCNQVDLRDVEADREHIDPGQTANVASAVGVKDGFALLARSGGNHCLAGNTVATNGVAHRIGMLDAAAEADPGSPVRALLDHLGDRCLDHVVNVGGTLELARDKFAAAAADAGHVD